MKITRELISEAIKLGCGTLPKFTAIELAAVLGVPLVYALRAIEANRKNFRFDQERNILSLDATNAVQTLNSSEVWNWYLKNRLGGNDKRCLPLSDQNRLNASVNQRVKWDINFGFVSATFVSAEITGADVNARVSSVYGQYLADRLQKLGTISGAGQIPDRYLFGVIVTEAEYNARKVAGLPLYTSEWAMEEMLTEIDWVTVEVGPKPGVEWVPVEEMKRGLPTPTATEDTSTQTILAAAQKQAVEQKTEEATKKGRRTKEQLDAARKQMVEDLVARGVSAGLSNRVQIAEKFSDAEKLYQEILEDLRSAEPGQQTLADAGVPLAAPEGSQTPADDSKPVVGLAIPPATVALAAPPVGEPVASRKSPMLTLASLENVADLKADIRAKAGGVTPQPVATAPVAPPAAQAVAQAPSVMPPPVAQAVPAGASSSAEDLLNSLLKSTGQG